MGKRFLSGILVLLLLCSSAAAALAGEEAAPAPGEEPPAQDAVETAAAEAETESAPPAEELPAAEPEPEEPAESPEPEPEEPAESPEPEPDAAAGETAGNAGEAGETPDEAPVLSVNGGSGGEATPSDAYSEGDHLIEGTNITWRFKDGVLSFTGTGEIPDFDTGTYTVGNAPWFPVSHLVRTFSVGEGITRVGACAADSCPVLEQIVLPEGVTELGDSAFIGCAMLSEVVLPSTLEIIGDNCFNGCSSLDGGLQHINFPEGLTYIGDYAFSYCPLAEAVLPESLEYIGAGAFYGTNLQTVTVPGGAALGAKAFASCYSLRSAVLEEGFEELPERCFSDCCQLAELTIPSTLTVLGPYAVHGTALKSLALPEQEGYMLVWADEEGNYLPESDILAESYTGASYVVWIREGGEFTDVPESAWYYEAVQFCYQAELMNGKSETVFDPAGTATRAQVVTVLWRLAGEPAAGAASFSDVPAGKYYSSAVAWAAEQQIAVGYPDDTFRPNNAVNRQEFLTFLYRFTEAWAGEQPAPCDLDPLEDFADRGQVGSWAQSAECWSVAFGLQQGSPKNGVLYLNPLQSIRRSEMAAFLMRYCILVVFADAG